LFGGSSALGVVVCSISRRVRTDLKQKVVGKKPGTGDRKDGVKPTHCPKGNRGEAKGKRLLTSNIGQAEPELPCPQERDAGDGQGRKGKKYPWGGGTTQEEKGRGVIPPGYSRDPNLGVEVWYNWVQTKRVGGFGRGRKQKKKTKRKKIISLTFQDGENTPNTPKKRRGEGER